jgi:hypothetical protein
VTLGTAVNSTTGTSGGNIADIDLGILAANYSNGSIGNGSKAKICCMQFFDTSDNCIVHIPISEGTGNLATDVCTGTVYTIANETNFTTFRNYTQDFSFYNFKNGFTLYQKSGSPDLRIPNKEDGTEIVPATIPSGYTRIANYKESKLSFNQCESLFKLDDVSAGVVSLTGTFPQAFWGGVMPLTVVFAQTSIQNGKPKYTSAAGDLVQWEDYGGFQWTIRSHVYLPGVQCYSLDNVLTPDLCTTWVGRGNNVTFVLSISGASDLYNADIDHFLFTESTGVAKEIDLKTLLIDDGKDRGYLYYNYSNYKNFMLYGTDKTLLNDVKVLKYIGLKDNIVYSGGEVVYDANNHAVLV